VIVYMTNPNPNLQWLPWIPTDMRGHSQEDINEKGNINGEEEGRDGE